MADIYETFDRNLYKSQDSASSSYEIDPDRITSGQSVGTVDPKYGVIIGYKTFDAVIDASGKGDFQTFKAAVDAGKTRLFVRNGTYVLSESLYLPNGVYVEGESKDGVRITSEADNYNIYVGKHGSADYSTGTISITNGSSTVTGSGTSWTGRTGQYIVIGTKAYLITGNSSATSITISETYQGKTISGQNYFIDDFFFNIGLKNLAITGDNVIRVLIKDVINLSLESINVYDTPGFLGTNSSQLGGVVVENVVTANIVAVSCSGLTNSSGLSLSEENVGINLTRCESSNNKYLGVSTSSGNTSFPKASNIINCLATANGGSGFGLLASMLVTGCVSTYNGGSGISASAESVVISNRCEFNSSAGIVGGHYVYENQCNGNGSVGIDSRAEQAIISNNYCRENLGSGIVIEADGDKSIVNNNICLNNSSHGIHFIADAVNCTVTGNICNNNTSFTSDGIFFNGNNDRNTITGNNCQGNGRYGINISAATCDKNIVTSNVMFGNATGQFNDVGTGTVAANNVIT